MRHLSLALATAVSCLASPLIAQDADAGAALYTRYCATCHGVTAQGDGPMSPSLVIQPPDLTGLSARNNGVFPVVRVVMRIDGREPLVSHGSPMPVYGPYFEGVANTAMKLPSGQPMLVAEPIADLVGYLQSVQAGN